MFVVKNIAMKKFMLWFLVIFIVGSVIIGYWNIRLHTVMGTVQDYCKSFHEREQYSKHMKGR